MKNGCDFFRAEGFSYLWADIGKGGREDFFLRLSDPVSYKDKERSGFGFLFLIVRCIFMSVLENHTGVRTVSGSPDREKVSFPVRIWRFYVQGFRSMTWGRTLWLIILLKLFVMFAILKVFFFPDFLKGKSREEKQDFVGNSLVERVCGSERSFLNR